ncbi:MAG: hypothetical protein N3C13_04745, partial [Aquificaceae bacterium]|nr:hypothetical protein [Aquificaceae bacterium]
RELSPEKAKEELLKIQKVIHGNARGYLVDDRILLAFGLFSLGPDAFRLTKRELVELVKEAG